MTETSEPKITDDRLQGLLTSVKKNAEVHEWEFDPDTEKHILGRVAEDFLVAWAERNKEKVRLKPPAPAAVPRGFVQVDVHISDERADFVRFSVSPFREIRGLFSENFLLKFLEPRLFTRLTNCLLMKIVYSDRCLEFGGSPESPERVRKAYELLSDKSYEFVEPKAASEEDIGRVHTEDHIQKIKDEDFFDPDTPAWDNCLG